MLLYLICISKLSDLLFNIYFRDVVNGQFENRIVLPDSDKHDIALCACIADVNMDTKTEILIGTFAKVSNLKKRLFIYVGEIINLL